MKLKGMIVANCEYLFNFFLVLVHFIFSKNFVDFSLGTQTVRLRIDSQKRFQTIIGFGGAFTDAVGININSLSEPAQINLLQSYFGSKGN